MAPGPAVLAVCLWLVVSGQIGTAQTTITVGQGGGHDHATIQAAIDAATTGDTVLVYPGTYVENIHFSGKNIILRGADPNDTATVAATVIDGNQAGSVVTFAGSETDSCILTGFTIRNGDAENGGGVYGFGAHATIQNNMIGGNSAYWGGGGLYDCDGQILNSTISGNSTRYDGGGLYGCDGPILNNTINGNSAYWTGGGLASCNGTILNNTISGNTTQYDGGGLASCDGTILNNTISGNIAGSGGGLYGCNGTIRNCAIWNNSALDGLQLFFSSTPSYSCIQNWTGGGEGNTSDDPLFITGPLGPYYLSQIAAGQTAQSPCVDAGSTTAAHLGLADRTTRTDQGGDTGIVDMGYHYPVVALRFSLTTAAYPPESGSVTPAGITFLDAGATITVTAIPNNGWSFEHWSGDVTGNANPISLTMDTAKTLTAHFVRIRYPLTTLADPPEGGVIAPSGTSTHDAGTTVPVTAASNDRWAFSHWSGDATGSMNPVVVTMNTTKTVTAHFVAVPGPDLTGRLDGVAPNTIVCGQLVSFQGAVSNAGDTGSTPTFWVEFWAVNVQTGERAFLCDSLTIGPLNPGESFNLADMVPARVAYDNIPAGTYAIEMRVDATNAVAESCETNNVVRREQRVILPNQPDLAVTAFGFSPQDVAPEGGTSMTFSGTVVNTGSQPTTGSFWIEFRVWPEPAFKPTGPYLCDSFRVGWALAPGETIDLATLPARAAYALPPGGYYVGVCLDPLDGIAEQREGNNVAWLTNKRLYVGPRPTDSVRWPLYR